MRAVSGVSDPSAPLRFPVRYGLADLTPDPERPQGWLLSVNGVPQSYVDLDDPGYLRFEYVRYLAFIVESLSPGTLEALHIGAGAFTLARYLAHTRPGSPQLAFEPDGELVEIVRERLGLEEIPLLRVSGSDGRLGVAECAAGSFDLVVLDAWKAAEMPPELSTAEFLTDVARVLRTGGCLAANLADGPDLVFARRIAATAREAFPHALLLADEAVLGGLVYGHIILACSPTPGAISAIADRVALQGSSRLTCLHGDDLESFRGQASPFRD